MITYSLLTKPGDRENNEDSIGMYQSDDTFCFALADGLGGHGKGEVASQLAVEAAMQIFAQKNPASSDWLETAFEHGQRTIIECQKSDRTASDMKTTLVLLSIGAKEIQWGYIGDSRLYYFQKEKFVFHSLDHSVPQMLVSAGKIKERQIRNHPDRNRLLRVMGMEWDSPRYEIAEKIERGGRQAFLLCSDGFWELIEEKKMMSCLSKASSPEEWLRLMEDIVLKNGKRKDMDNYSAIGIWAE